MQVSYHLFLQRPLLNYFILSFLVFHVITYIQYASNEKNPPVSPSHTKTHENDQIEAVKKLIESKFSLIEERISSVAQQIKSQNVEFVSLISKIQELTQIELELGRGNSAHVSHLNEEMKKLRSELEDT